MLVSWRWLQDYVKVDLRHEELTDRLAMAGLNHEGTEVVADDFAIDLEVTSNRPDCLGHIGVAREIAVLRKLPLSIPDATPPETGDPIEKITRVEIEVSELCPRYTVRVVRGVNVGPSPDWLVQRLATIGVSSINNIVDITNFVLMECGQPLHAFDFAKLRGGRIYVRSGWKDELFQAIDHRTYPLLATDCVIADAERAIALGGVMGGAETEVSDQTRDVLIESAEFDPLTIRTTARRLNLHSPSSYRFERGVDPGGVDWASRRCCDMILELAGGELANGAIDERAQPAASRPPVTLRFSQLKRVLGIEVPRDTTRQILTALGHQETSADEQQVVVVPPSWRRDLAREIDLIEEVARIHGYDKIPEDVGVAMTASHRTDRERVLAKIRQALTACGFSEAITPSVVSEENSAVFSPWSQEQPLHCSTAMLRGSDRLRRSLLPSLLAARQTNEALANQHTELFETAKIYLPTGGDLPTEPWMLALTSGRSWDEVKGALEALVSYLNPRQSLATADWTGDFFEPSQACELVLQGETIGCLGQITSATAKKFGLRGPAIAAELKIAALESISELVPQHEPASLFPSTSRDVNLIVAEKIPWASIATAVSDACGEMLERLDYRETYRNPERDGTDRKRLLFSFVLRSSDGTLTGQQADEVRDRVVAKCADEFDAVLI